MANTGDGGVRVLKAHLALNVKNVERSIEFYRKMLGLEPLKVRPGYAKFDVQNPPLNLTLNQVQFGERGALSHMGLQVASTEDVLSMRRKWADAGLVPRDEMQTNCCYAMQDKSWVHDPDGNEWEVFVVLQDNLVETSMCCVTDQAEKVEGVETAATAAAAASCATPQTSVANAEANISCGSPATASAAEAGSSCCSTAAPVSLSR
jgi:catechol 2,3-dioxygenase-like lactoylglutathione lyase family enzyme